MLCIAQTSTECSEVGANTPLLRSRRQTPLWCLSACTGEVYWEAGCYWQDGIGPYIPGENIEATLRNGGKSFKKGKDLEKYVSVTDLYVPLDYGENLSKTELIKRYEYRDTRPMVVSRARILRTRPRFDQWKITFNLMYDEEKIDLDTIVNAMDVSGSYVGLCDSRPKYGKFCATIKEID